jgi:hypothetical protein
MALTKTQQILSNDVDALFVELGLTSLSEEEKLDSMEDLIEHFNQIIIETVIINLNDNQLKEFRAAMDEEDEYSVQEKIIDITSRVPGLAEKIEQAVEHELTVLKAAKLVLDK